MSASLRDFRASTMAQLVPESHRVAAASRVSRTLHDPTDMAARDTLQAMGTVVVGPMRFAPVVMRRVRPQYGRGVTLPTRGRIADEALRDHGQPPHPADDYEALLALDENNVSKGISIDFQRRLLKEKRFDQVRAAPPASAQGTTGAKCTSCLVCREDFEPSTLVVELPRCRHLFHFSCVSPWLVRDRTCPTCRTEVHEHAVP